MINFFRTFLIFLYFCFVIFIKPCEVFAHNLSFFNNLSLNYVTETKSNLIKTEETEQYYSVIQNKNDAQITNNNNNKKSNLFIAFDVGYLSAYNELNHLAFYKNKIFCYFIKDNQIQNLKYTIYTRAP